MHKQKKFFRYTVIFEEAPEGGYIARVPALGCVTEGENFEDAKKMAQDASRCFLESLIKHGEPIPKESPNEIVSSLTVPMVIASR